jgi:hypothetical protein
MAPVPAFIDSNFHGGAITIVSADDVRGLELRLRPDNASDFAQWFYFRVYTPRGVEQVLHIRGVETAAVPKGWPDYRACVSADLACHAGCLWAIVHHGRRRSAQYHSKP